MTEQVFERARRKIATRKKVLENLWLAAVAVTESPTEDNLKRLRAAVETIRGRMNPPPPPPSNPKSPWAV